MKKEYISPEFDLVKYRFAATLANDPHLVHSDPQGNAEGGDGHGDGDPRG